MRKYTWILLGLCLVLLILPCAATDIPTLNIESLREYRKFASENALPDHFITCEQLSCFGDFEHLVFLEGTADPAALKYERYDYSFSNSPRDSRDQYVSLTLYYYTDGKYAKRKGDANVDPEKIISSVPDGNMRSIPNEQSGVYITDGVEYRYVKGRLLSIEWSDDNYVYILNTSSHLDTVTDKNELVNKFLTYGKTAQAIEDFYQSVYPDQDVSGAPTDHDEQSTRTNGSTPPEKAPIPTAVLIAVPVVAAAAIVGCFAIRAQKKR